MGLEETCSHQSSLPNSLNEYNPQGNVNNRLGQKTSTNREYRAQGLLNS